MKLVVQIEHRASSSRGKHEGESSHALCDRLSRTRDNSQRQLPTDQDYAVSTREYQTDQSSLKTAPTAARSVLDKRPHQRQQQTQRVRRLTRSLHIRPMRSLTLCWAAFRRIGLHKRRQIRKRRQCTMDTLPSSRVVAGYLTRSPIHSFRLAPVLTDRLAVISQARPIDS